MREEDDTADEVEIEDEAEGDDSEGEAETEDEDEDEDEEEEEANEKRNDRVSSANDLGNEARIEATASATVLLCTTQRASVARGAALCASSFMRKVFTFKPAPTNREGIRIWANVEAMQFKSKLGSTRVVDASRAYPRVYSETGSSRCTSPPKSNTTKRSSLVSAMLAGLRSEKQKLAVWQAFTTSNNERASRTARYSGQLVHARSAPLTLARVTGYRG